VANPLRPSWWEWDLFVSAHALERMAERDFSELDLRTMLHDAHRVVRDIEPGRWVVEARLREWPWEIILEPDGDARRIIVVTAYPLD